MEAQEPNTIREKSVPEKEYSETRETRDDIALRE